MNRPLAGGSLIVVGTGISLIGQVTLEAQSAMRAADLLFYLTVEGAMGSWLREQNARAVSLLDAYSPSKPREKTYDEIVDRITGPVREELKVCAAFYGHPGIFVDPSHRAIAELRAEGYPARMLPGISAEDCLFADLGLDPAETGCQSYEATDFLVHGRGVDTTSGLVLWQIGFIGEENGPTSVRLDGLRVLSEVLLTHYPERHEGILYEASIYPVCKPLIRPVRLSRLAEASPPPMATLYVPPSRKPTVNEEMRRRLKGNPI